MIRCAGMFEVSVLSIELYKRFGFLLSFSHCIMAHCLLSSYRNGAVPHVLGPLFTHYMHRDILLLCIISLLDLFPFPLLSYSFPLSFSID